MKLDLRQLRAVEASVKKPVLLVAGAGSGKTTIVVNRVKFLVEEAHIRAEDILCMTFTKKAAQEMSDRLQSLSDRLGRVTVGTIHSVCYRIIRDSGMDLKVISMNDQKAILEKTAKDIGLKVGWKTLLTWNQYLVMNYTNWEERRLFTYKFFNETMMLATNLATFRAQQISQILQKYEDFKQQQSLLDFVDMLTIVDREILAEDNDYSGFQKTQIILDENQDSNDISFSIARKLMKPNGSMFAVGDPDQSVYGFNGSNPKNNIFGFGNNFPSHQLLKLQRNYRSSQEIVELGDKIIAGNYNESNQSFRKKMSWRKRNNGGEKVTFAQPVNEDDEAIYVVDKIKELNSLGYEPKDIFILYRTNAQSRALEDVLVEENIPYSVKNSHGFYNRKKVKDILGYIKLALDNASDDDFERVYNIASNGYSTYYRGLGKSFLSRCLDHDNNYWGGMLELQTTLYSSDRIWRAIRDFRDMVETLRSCFVDHATGELLPVGDQRTEPVTLVKLVRSLCYDEYLKRSEGYVEEEGEDFFRELEQLEVAASRFDNMSSFLKHIRKMQRVHEAKEDESVVLSTVHRAKGLERPIVFGVGISEGLLPHARSNGQISASSNDIPSPYISTVEDERCIAFVLVTRAKERLYLTSPSMYANKIMIPSRFISEAGIIAKAVESVIEEFKESEISNKE